MLETAFIAIDDDALYDKSKVYIGRAMRKKADDLDEYQLWASLALELLGKAALAGQHPCLVVDPTHWQSLFVAAGVNETTDVKTIAAKTLFQRLGNLVPKFDSDVQNFCQAIAERRNAELHSGALPFKTMNLDAWEARYWHACDTILQKMDASLEQWLGADVAAAPRQLLVAAVKARKEAVNIRVETAGNGFKKRKKADRERLAADAQLLKPQQQASLFKGPYDAIWTENCLACDSQAFMAGMHTGEEISVDKFYGDYTIWETVDRVFEGEEFQCPACGLALFGSAEMEAANIDNSYVEQIERELEYEPEYGND